MKQLLNNIYWFLYKLTPKGKRAYILKQGFAGFKQSNAETNITKLGIIANANKLLKTKKILAFNNGESISKSKKSDFEVIKNVSINSAEELSQKGLKITKQGKFVKV